MSLALAIAYPDRVEMLTDAAIFDEDGRLTAIRPKVWFSKKASFAVSSTGHYRTGFKFICGLLLAGWLGRDFDWTMAALARSLASMRRRPRDRRQADVVIAGISASAGPQVYVFRTARAGNDSDEFLPALQLVKTNGFAYLGPTPPVGSPWQLYNSFDSGIERNARPFLDQARAAKPAVDVHTRNGAVGVEAGSLHVIGGFATLTIVRPGPVIESKVIRRWSDKVGEPIKAVTPSWMR